MKKIFFLYWLPVIIWAGTIFFLSSTSSFPDEVRVFSKFSNLIHMLEYAGLAFLIARALKQSPQKKLSNNFRILAIIFTILYGITDEIHQSFVPLRDPSLFDLVFDSIGAVVGQIFMKKL